MSIITAIAAGPDVAIFVFWLFWHLVRLMENFDERQCRILDLKCIAVSWNRV
jgi:hypothetical protein